MLIRSRRGRHRSFLNVEYTEGIFLESHQVREGTISLTWQTTQTNAQGSSKSSTTTYVHSIFSIFEVACTFLIRSASHLARTKTPYEFRINQLPGDYINESENIPYKFANYILPESREVTSHHRTITRHREGRSARPLFYRTHNLEAWIKILPSNIWLLRACGGREGGRQATQVVCFFVLPTEQLANLVVVLKRCTCASAASELINSSSPSPSAYPVLPSQSVSDRIRSHRLALAPPQGQTSPLPYGSCLGIRDDTHGITG